jgi:uncharacterized protein YfaQ (DUF2300 family)
MANFLRNRVAHQLHVAIGSAESKKATLWPSYMFDSSDAAAGWSVLAKYGQGAWQGECAGMLVPQKPTWRLHGIQKAKSPTI